MITSFIIAGFNLQLQSLAAPKNIREALPLAKEISKRISDLLTNRSVKEVNVYVKI
jgi:hypothetical protein